MKSDSKLCPLIRSLLVAMIVFVWSNLSIAQPVLPARIITVTPTQSIHFGTFCLIGGSGGDVIVGFNGARTSNGDIVLLSRAPSSQPAIFEIKLCEGRNVTISFSATATLTGSNGGSFIMDIGPTDKGVNGASFSTISDCNFITPLRVGGTLHVPGTALPGIYSGSFSITFIQE